MSRFHTRLIDPKRWAVVRGRILIRDGHRCRVCGRAGRLEVDHVKPLQFGGDLYGSENLQALCRPCHIEKTSRENRKPVPPEVQAWRALLAEMSTGLKKL